jgi:hypothetical protein
LGCQINVRNVKQFGHFTKACIVLRSSIGEKNNSLSYCDPTLEFTTKVRAKLKVSSHEQAKAIKRFKTSGEHKKKKTLL